jgi:hypothetical protein
MSDAETADTIERVTADKTLFDNLNTGGLQSKFEGHFKMNCPDPPQPCQTRHIYHP